LKKWPLVVTCHGTPPWDNASLQIREWAGLAEHEGFVVAAPVLKGTSGITPPVEKQIELQRSDERTILGVVSHVKAGYSIAEGQVFLTGWSAGGYAVLWTGLKHPEVFRALAIRQGNFDERFLRPIEDLLDRNQPILVFYGQVDFLRAQSRACIDWLRSHGMLVFSDELPGAHRRMPQVAWQFFRRVVRRYPWCVMRYRILEQGNGLTARFWINADPQPQRVRWEFGDGQTGYGTAVEHTYSRGGRYTVCVSAEMGKFGLIERRRSVLLAPGQAD